MTPDTPAMDEKIDAAAKHLRETMQAGKKLTPWESTPKATKKKWLALAEGTLRAAGTYLAATAREDEATVEQIAECIWQAEWKRAGNGGLRRVPWSELNPNDHERYRFVAREVAALSTAGAAEPAWQSIETAPTNRAILIHVPNLDYYGNDGVYAGMLVDMGTGKRWMTFGWAMGRDLGDENAPVAWRSMPLVSEEKRS